MLGYTGGVPAYTLHDNILHTIVSSLSRERMGFDAFSH